MKRHAAPRPWRGPTVVGVLTAIGLVAALVTEGPWDALASALLAVPVALALWFSLRAPPRR